MPLPIIRTERMTLIPWTRKDVDALHGFWTLPEVRRFLWDDVVINIDVVEDSVASHLATVEQHSIGYWNIHLAAQESSPKKPLAGFCGFRFVDGGPEIELMYGLRPEYWGKGLALWSGLPWLQNQRPKQPSPTYFAGETE